MSDEIEIKEATASPVGELEILQARPAGWMGWYRYTPDTSFSMIYGFADEARRDYFRCPYPLFETREDVIEAAKRALHGRGGEVRIVKVTL